ncbi:hypothetical protein [Halorientalis litorea]|uniref:hypothetical protein n=1 Tax=Halorientalis litorea TaxID=2931977 RepID=UPI001FF3C341|nr:hypothetical protein [Halorientalis litorea]
MSDDDPVARVTRPLRDIRADRSKHLAALAMATGVGLLAARSHWAGLVLGGALVALVSPTLRRGVLAALGFGGLVLAVFAVTLGGDAALLPEMAPVSYVAVASALGLPLFGSLVRAAV